MSWWWLDFRLGRKCRTSQTVFIAWSSVTHIQLWVEEDLGFPVALPYRFYQSVWETFHSSGFLAYHLCSALTKDCPHLFLPSPVIREKLNIYSSTIYLDVFKLLSVISLQSSIKLPIGLSSIFRNNCSFMKTFVKPK